MALLPLLRKGAVIAHAVVDDADYPKYSAHTWLLHPGGYAYRILRDEARHPRNVFLHRDILGLPVACGRAGVGAIYGDHVNGDRLDNRRANLRVLSHAQSAQNRRGNRNSTSRFRGVSWSNTHQRWVAKVSGKTLGRFADEAEAARVAAAERRRLLPYSHEAAA